MEIQHFFMVSFKEMDDFKEFSKSESINLAYIYNNKNVLVKNLEFKYNNIVMTSSISITISSITLVILLFILMNRE